MKGVKIASDSETEIGEREMRWRLSLFERAENNQQGQHL